MLLDKYGISDDKPLIFKKKQRESIVWKRVVWSSELLKARLSRRLSNGKRALFWLDRWVGDATLRSHNALQVEEEKLFDTASELWDDGCG